MSQQEFLKKLRRELEDLPAGDVDEIIEDYRSYFDEALAAGRPIEDVIAAHGDPRQLAKELRTELDLRQWEKHHSPANFWKAIFALGSLAVADIFILVPALLSLAALTLILFFILSLFGVIGIGTLLDLLSSGYEPSEGSVSYFLFRGIGFLIASFGGGVLLVFALRGVVNQLTRYARLHYRLLPPTLLSAEPSDAAEKHSNNQHAREE
ncbi:MAG: DUF1700 domain-containing protein [Sneathiellales bacterium]|nr:DUF1700 domain-containing protein [Sneathiellales bacterium]